MHQTRPRSLSGPLPSGRPPHDRSPLVPRRGYRCLNGCAPALGLVVRFALKHGAGDAFDRLTSETVEQIRAHEPGTLLYAVHRVEGDPDARLFYELYRDRAAF